MMQRRLGSSRPYTSAALFAIALLTGTAGGGCSGSVASSGSGSTDGGIDALGATDGGIDATGACAAADCAGLGAPAQARPCPDGTSVSATLCERQPSGQCNWGFPACTTDADGGIDAAGDCTAADCAGLVRSALALSCPDGTSVSATVCERQPSGQCDWGFPACPPDAGQHCTSLGCNPNCPNGVLKDANGCDTCQCAPVAGDGGMAACANDADCPHGHICGYLESAGCAATGQCFLAPGVRCAIASSVGCGCNGSEVPIDPSCVSGLPTGYQPSPVLHRGACTDAGGACVSQRGGRCGGNTTHPCTCASTLACTPGDSGLPFGDIGGTCE